MRIGFGNDIHRLECGRKLFLGGLNMPYEKGCIAPSDGDVLIHALIDAILGALALGDIGTFFPPEDDKYKDIDSKLLLEYVIEKAKPEFVNIDATITLESFKLKPYIQEIRKSIATLCAIDCNRVSVKAKTNEGLDSLGSDSAIKAEVIVLLNN